MVRWKQGHPLHPTAVTVLTRVGKTCAITLMPNRGEEYIMPLDANMDQSSVCVGLQLVIFANSVAQAADFEWHNVEVEARPPIVLHSCHRLGKCWKGMCQHLNASMGPGPYANMGQSSVCVGLR